MKNVSRIIFIVVVTILLMGSSVQAQLDASQDVNVYAEILDTITIDPGEVGVQDMDFSFGTSPQGDDAVITLETNGNLSVASTGTVFWNNTGTPAVVQVGGTAGRAYEVRIESTEVSPGLATGQGAPSINLDSNDTADILTVDRFTVEGTNVSNGVFHLNPSTDQTTRGLDTLTIGAVLTVPAGTDVASYSGMFNLTVSYE